MPREDSLAGYFRPEVDAMLVKGDVKCLHCGFISGEWVGAGGSPLTLAGFRAVGEQPQGDPSAPVRCGRCSGPVLLDEVNPVISTYRIRRIRRLREQLAAMDARRGRAA
jgi:DNA-directed RNA polymerase subunit RPC12/RpoP